MYRQPHKKQPKKPANDASQRPPSTQKPNFIQRNKQVSINTKKTPAPSVHQTIPQKVERLEKAVEKLSGGVGDTSIQGLLLEEIRGIKSELREIKAQIGMSPERKAQGQGYEREQQEEEGYGEEENIANMIGGASMGPGPTISKVEQSEYHPPPSQVHQQHLPPIHQSQVHHQPPPQPQAPPQQIRDVMGGGRSGPEKKLIEIGKIQPYMKEFKLQGSKDLPLPFYRGYHKKSSKPVVIKYTPEELPMDPIINLYDKLWKNIVKAKKVCINKVYDLNEPLASNILAIEMNPHSISEIALTAPQIIGETLRAVQFMHECGYLYRNVHPEHVMGNAEGNVVLLDLKRMRRFVDARGKVIEVRGKEEEGLDAFVSNARLRNIPQGRKDDLESVGYLALWLLEGTLPWGVGDMLQKRAKLTMQALFGKYGGLFDYMVTVHKMTTEQMPKYDALHQMLAQM